MDTSVCACIGERSRMSISYFGVTSTIALPGGGYFILVALVVHVQAGGHCRSFCNTAGEFSQGLCKLPRPFAWHA
jgi:hypothetical protein